jgi:hypothetical protein
MLPLAKISAEPLRAGHPAAPSKIVLISELFLLSADTEGRCQGWRHVERKTAARVSLYTGTEARRLLLADPLGVARYSTTDRLVSPVHGTQLCPAYFGMSRGRRKRPLGLLH